jgi:hypothetical protein
LFYLCALGLLAFSAYHLFSPWRLVIEIHLASDGSDTASDGSAITVIPGKDGSHVKLTEQNRKKDEIDQNFGDLEEALLKSIGEQSIAPIRSRDDSIGLLYNIKSPSDWLDLVEGHDDHVCILLFPFSVNFKF